MKKKKKKRAAVLKEPVRRDASDRTKKRKRRPTARKKAMEKAVNPPPVGKKSRKRRGISAGQVDLIYKLALGISLAAAVIFVVTTFFRVRTIEVVGTQECRPEQVATASGVSLEDKLLFVSRSDAARDILEALPYVDEVRISKRFPSTLRIVVTESEPAATVVSGGVSYVIDKNRKLLEYGPFDEAELIGLRIEGLSVTEPVAGKTIGLSDELRQTSLAAVLDCLLEHPMLEQIGRINMEKLYSISFSYDERIVVTVGDSLSLTEKLDMLGAVLEGFDGTEKGHMDVSEITQARFLPDNAAVENFCLPAADVTQEQTPPEESDGQSGTQDE